MDAQETRIYTAILITSFVLGVIILFFVVSIIRQQRRNLDLHKMNILAEITTLEKERARMAHDLHDELGPVLAAVKMKISSFELTDEGDKEEMNRTNEHIDMLMKRIREISFDLMPSSLLRKGLGGAIKEFVSYISNQSSLKVRLQLEDLPDLAEQKTIHLYRISQEVVHNTIKHAKANVLQISLQRQKDNVILSTRDDGVGFDYDKRMLAQDGIGLRSLKSRVEIMNGQLFIESRKGKGTSYIFQIPIS
ncbi:MAG: hypothetical protein JWP88_721 [Flaviaesturariibacter sp.]|nr:hypothetical protein [Flaviaesturariibacter sp.]